MTDWTEDAQCRRHPPDWWVAGDNGRGKAQVNRRVAIHICRTHCPVRVQCEADALARPRYVAGGVYGGVYYVGNQSEAEPLKRQPRPLPSHCPECGQTTRDEVHPPAPAPKGEPPAIGYIEQRLPFVRSMRAAGLSYREIAAELGCSPAGVKSACWRHGIKAGPRRGTRRLGVKSEHAFSAGRAMRARGE